MSQELLVLIAGSATLALLVLAGLVLSDRRRRAHRLPAAWLRVRDFVYIVFTGYRASALRDARRSRLQHPDCAQQRAEDSHQAVKAPQGQVEKQSRSRCVAFDVAMIAAGMQGSALDDVCHLACVYEVCPILLLRLDA